MPEQLNQSLFAEITKPKAGVVQARLIGPSIGQREAPIIAELVVPALDECGEELRFLILDFSHITFINSMGLGICIDFRNRAAKLGGKVILHGMNQQLTDLFKMVKVDRLFTIVKDNAELAKTIEK